MVAWSLLSVSSSVPSLLNSHRAVEAEDGLRYNEPPDWKIPGRHFLGAELLEAGQYSEAEKVYLEDLKKNPENGWSLKGLSLCQEKLGKKSRSRHHNEASCQSLEEC